MKNFCVILICLLPSIANAQVLSLEDALNIGKSITLIEASQEEELKNLQLKIKKSKRLPIIYGDGSLQRNIIIPVTPVPAIAFNPSANPNEITPLRFATDWTAKAGLQASIDLFNPQNHNDINNAALELAKAKNNTQNSKQDFNKLIIDNYTQLALALEQERIAQENVDKYNLTKNTIEERYKAGRISKIEFNNAVKQYQDLVQIRDEASIVVLNKQIQLAQYVDFDFNDHISTTTNEINNYIKKKQNYSLDNLKLNFENQKLKLQLIKWEALPKITLNGFYGANYFDNSLRLLDNNNWYGNSFVSLNLRLPISEHYEKSLSSKILRNQIFTLQEKISYQEKEDLKKDLIKKNEINVYEKKLQTLYANKQLINNNIEILQEQLQQGTILVSVVNQEILNLLNLEQQIIQTQYDLIKKQLE